MVGTNVSAVAAGGLTLDIAGALLLASGLMFKPPRKAIEEASPMWDFNAALEANVASQTADAQVGAVLLVAGFVAQLVSALGVHAATWSDVAVAAGSAAVVDLVAVAFLLLLWRRWHIRRLLAARLAALADTGVWGPALAAYGHLLGQPAPPGIGVDLTAAEYGEQLLGARWRQLVEGRVLPDGIVKLRRDLVGTAEYEAAHGATGATADF